jgi:hypothetical protein
MAGEAATLSGSVRVAKAGTPGSPVEGARVVLYQSLRDSRGRDSVGARLDSALTGARGEYGFARVDTGRVRIWASKAGYPHLNGSGYAAVPRDTGRYTVDIVFPDTTPGQLRVSVARDSLGGKGLAGATLVLGGFGDEPKDTVKTDADGRYTFASLFPTTYTLTVEAEGFEGSYLYASYASPTVPPGGTDSVGFILWPKNAKGPIAGNVAKASDGSAVPGAKVTASLTANGADYFTPITAITGPDGSYGLEGVPALPNITLTVEATGYQPAVAAGFPVVYGRTRAADFLLVPATEIGDGLGSVSGIAADTAFNPLAGARITLDSGWSAGPGQSRFAFDTDSKGRFVFPKVSAGEYRVSASRNGYQYSQANTLRVTPDRTLVLYLSLRKAPIIGITARASGGSRLHAGPAGGMVLESPALPVAGRVRAYDIRGALRFSRTLPAGATRLEIPWSGRAGYIVFERGREFRRWAVPAAP